MATIYKCCHGQTIRPGKGWTDENGVAHPASWHTYSADRKAELGITEIVQQPHPDSRLYTWSYNDDGTVTSTAKSLEDTPNVDENGTPIIDPDTMAQTTTPGLKSQWIAQIKQTQGSLLSQTDWAYVRKVDTGISVPTEIQTYRDEVRLAASAIEDQISQCADFDAFKALFVIPTDADGNPTGNAPIHNWPDPV